MAETSIVLKGGTAEELQELAFEARSSKDNAWYDVSTFLNHRVVSTGELEARVRFAGFGISHDEWVNVRTGVRERSFPLDPSECHKVKVGDSVLCFQERPDYAVYVDAHIMEIQRRLHDIMGCRCIYVVRFDDDKTEGNIVTGKSFNRVRDELRRLGYLVRQYRPIYDGKTKCFMRSIVLELESGMDNYRQAFKLQRAFERAGQGRAEYENQVEKTAGPHAWVATEDDIVYTKVETTYRVVSDDGIVGGYDDSDRDPVSTYMSVMTLLALQYSRFYQRNV